MGNLFVSVDSFLILHKPLPLTIMRMLFHTYILNDQEPTFKFYIQLSAN